MQPESKQIAGERSWIVESDQVQLALTERGGHMAPVIFYRRDDRTVQPYYVNPWHDENLSPDPPVLRVLRGDFFCLPFGANGSFKGEEYTVHGETATKTWKLVSYAKDGPVTSLVTKMDTSARPGTVTKRLSLIDGQNAVYVQHEIDGYSGKMPLGHHATLLPPEEEGGMAVSKSPILFGMVAPSQREPYAGREYHSLEAGARFKRLDRVPTIWKEPAVADCSVFPARRGFVDILQLYDKPGKHPAWTAAAVPSRGYLWYSLKDPAVLPSTVFWMENRGRYGTPWLGRNSCIGLEEVCAFFAEGIEASLKKNPVSEEGIATSVVFPRKGALRVNSIQGVVKIPKGFDRVKTVRFSREGVEFVSEAGPAIAAAVEWSFVTSGELTRR